MTVAQNREDLQVGLSLEIAQKVPEEIAKIEKHQDEHRQTANKSEQRIRGDMAFADDGIKNIP